MSPITKHWREANAKLKDKVLSAPAPADPHAALDRMAADAERLGLYDEPTEVPLPEPFTQLPLKGSQTTSVSVWASDGMRAYAAACVAAERDRCAGLCETRLSIAHIDSLRDEGWSVDEIRGYETALAAMYGEILRSGGSDA